MDLSKVYMVTCESVTEGHPDKFCDQIADNILDDIMSHDPVAHVAIEVLATEGKIVVAGEVTSSYRCNYRKIVRRIIMNVGYSEKDIGTNSEIEVLVHEQSPDIAQGVDRSNGSLGAGDQGIMYGYATIETPHALPLPYVIATDLTAELDLMRHQKELPIRPDGKVQITVAYDRKTDRPIYIDTVVCSVQHRESDSVEYIRDVMRAFIIDFLKENYHYIMETTSLEKMKIYINPTGRFVIGGPVGDTGLTGRKLAVDTYGGVSHHGGGALSGKDPTKVDRSAAYGARYVAKHIVATGLVDHCEVSVSYAIGKTNPVHIRVDTGDQKRDAILEYIIEQLFDLSPAGIINTLHLRSTRYAPTAVNGHFTKTDAPWEKFDDMKLGMIRSMYKTYNPDVS